MPKILFHNNILLLVGSYEGSSGANASMVDGSIFWSGMFPPRSPPTTTLKVWDDLAGRITWFRWNWWCLAEASEEDIWWRAIAKIKLRNNIIQYIYCVDLLYVCVVYSTLSLTKTWTEFGVWRIGFARSDWRERYCWRGLPVVNYLCIRLWMLVVSDVS